MDTTPKPEIVTPPMVKEKDPHFYRLTLPLYIIAGAVVLAGVMVAGTFIYTQHVAIEAAYAAANQQGVAAAGTNGQPANKPVNVSAVKTAGEPFIGNANAPVTIAEWSDYQCPFCKQFEMSVLPQLVANYVTAGKVKIVFKDFQFLGPDSLTAAEVGRAVWQAYPGQFYAWRQAMYQNQASENHAADPNGLTNYLAITKTVPGIDATKIAQLIAQNKTQYDAAINADQQEGGSFGVNGTPSFVIGNGNPIVIGGGSLSQFSSLIDPVLKK